MAQKMWRWKYCVGRAPLTSSTPKECGGTANGRTSIRRLRSSRWMNGLASAFRSLREAFQHGQQLLHIDGFEQIVIEAFPSETVRLGRLRIPAQGDNADLV